jgi:hypothetical protein
MNSKNYLIASMVVFDLVALLQLLRMYFGWPVNIAGTEIPMQASAAAFIVASALAVWAFMLLRKQPS